MAVRQRDRPGRGAGRAGVAAMGDLHDYREAAELSEKLADKYVEIRELTLLRWRVTGAVAGLGAAGVAVADMLYGHLALWITGLVGAAVPAVTGRRKDGSPGRRAVLAGPRSLTWTMDPQILVDAFRDAKLIGKDEPCAWSNAPAAWRGLGYRHRPPGHPQGHRCGQKPRSARLRARRRRSPTTR
jgi:hypothetical protein